MTGAEGECLASLPSCALQDCHSHLQSIPLWEQGQGGAGVGGVLGAAFGGEALEELDGAVVARDAEGAEQRLAVFQAARRGPDFEEHVHSVGLAGAAEDEGGLFGYLIGGCQELGGGGGGGGGGPGGAGVHE